LIFEEQANWKDWATYNNYWKPLYDKLYNELRDKVAKEITDKVSHYNSLLQSSSPPSAFPVRKLPSYSLSPSETRTIYKVVDIIEQVMSLRKTSGLTFDARLFRQTIAQLTKYCAVYTSVRSIPLSHLDDNRKNLPTSLDKELALLHGDFGDSPHNLAPWLLDCNRLVLGFDGSQSITPLAYSHNLAVIVDKYNATLVKQYSVRLKSAQSAWIYLDEDGIECTLYYDSVIANGWALASNICAQASNSVKWKDRMAPPASVSQCFWNAFHRQGMNLEALDKSYSYQFLIQSNLLNSTFVQLPQTQPIAPIIDSVIIKLTCVTHTTSRKALDQVVEAKKISSPLLSSPSISLDSIEQAIEYTQTLDPLASTGIIIYLQFPTHCESYRIQSRGFESFSKLMTLGPVVMSESDVKNELIELLRSVNKYVTFPPV